MANIRTITTKSFSVKDLTFSIESDGYCSISIKKPSVSEYYESVYFAKNEMKNVYILFQDALKILDLFLYDKIQFPIDAFGFMSNVSFTKEIYQNGNVFEIIVVGDGIRLSTKGCYELERHLSSKLRESDCREIIEGLEELMK